MFIRTFSFIFLFAFLSNMAYADDLGGAKDLISAKKYPEAFKLLSALSSRGNADAKYELGKLYEDGKADKNDLQMANKLYKQSIKISGNSYAKLALAINMILGRGILQNYGAAKSLLAEASKTNVYALYVIGNLNAQGLGYKKSQKQALSWYLKAADRGFLPAMKLVFKAYKKGVGVKPNDELAFYWANILASKKYKPIYYDLGVMYELGKGVAPNLIKAHIYYNLSSSTGNPRAYKALDLLSKKLPYKDLLQAQQEAKQILSGLDVNN